MTFGTVNFKSRGSGQVAEHMPIARHLTPDKTQERSQTAQPVTEFILEE